MKISTEEVKELLKECAAQMEECRPQDFRQYIRLHSDKDCTDGQLAGAIRQLAEKGELIKIERGIYAKGDGTYSIRKKTVGYGESSFAIDIADCFADTAKRLELIVESVDVLNMGEADFSLLGEIRKIKEDMETISSGIYKNK